MENGGGVRKLDNSRKTCLLGWRDGSVVKSSCSCRLASQDPRRAHNLLNFRSKGSNVLFQLPKALGSHVVHIHIYVENRGNAE